jgi:hypothetical protein
MGTMQTLTTFFEEPLGRLFWLTVIAVTVLIGLHRIGGPAGYLVAALAVLPFAMMLTGTRPLLGVMRAARGQPAPYQGS